MNYDREQQPDFQSRQQLIITCLAIFAVLLIARAVYLQVFEREFLQKEGENRHFRVVSLPANRGIVTDRNGLPLAVSTPVKSVYANPQEIVISAVQLRHLANALGLSEYALQNKIEKNKNKKFVFLKRRVEPSVSRKVANLNIPGIGLRREIKRYYPLAQVNAHVIGYTDIHDKGQEGIELVFDKHLSGVNGRMLVRKDNFGDIVGNVNLIKPSIQGRKLVLSIDQRLQYLAYREIAAAVKKHHAVSASIVILDVKTGEILAMANSPSFNPNVRRRYDESYRNRAVTDLIEPGSTIKPLVIAAGLKSGMYARYSRIETSPGWIWLGNKKVHDARNYGTLSLEEILVKSSNVGVSKVGLGLGSKQLWQMYRDLGFGQRTHSALSGEVTGFLPHHTDWDKVSLASRSYGYGLSVTVLQLAKAYATIANQGISVPLTILKRREDVNGIQVMDAEVASQVLQMIERVVSPKGTGRRAAVPGYRVAGKTGTVKKLTESGYSNSKYYALFAGVAPVSQPRLAIVVAVNEPKTGVYYGGQVAAPIFSKVMQGSLRLLNIAPDATRLTNQELLVDKRL